MKNFEVTDKETNKKYWISRSIAVLAMVIVTNEPNGPKTRISKIKDKRENEIEGSVFTSAAWGSNEVEESYEYINQDYRCDKYVLVNKRGSGTPNFQGYWNIPCGYLDFNERLTECATREVEEECGIYIDPTAWQIFLPIDDLATVGDQKQNVTIRYTVNLTMDEFRKACEYGKMVKKHYKGESNEVEAVDLMLLTKENIESRKWAFNHRTLLEMQLEKTEYIF